VETRVDESENWSISGLPELWQLADSRAMTAVTVPEDADGVRLVLMGDLDSESAGPVHRAVLNAVREYRPTRIVLHLSEVEFLDAAGVRSLLASRADAARVGCKLIICRAMPSVRGVLEATGLLEVFGVHDHGDPAGEEGCYVDDESTCPPVIAARACRA
jgi:anti-sigma B factor antagonist